MNKAVKMMTDGMEMIIVVVWKKVAMRGAHAGQIHMMRPDDERQEADDQNGIDERFDNPRSACGCYWR